MHFLHLVLAAANPSGNYPSLGYDPYPTWLRVTHWINALFFGFMVRAGIQILASYPRLYWNDHMKPGTEWLKFTKRDIPKDKIWITLEEEVDVSPVLAQPGGNNLGLGRHWHFAAAVFWIANGLVYVGLLLSTGLWKDIVPINFRVIPGMWDTFVTYMTFHVPAAHYFRPYDPLQRVAYGFVVFILAPFQIATAMAQSPAIEGRFPWYSKLFGGRQSARSLHFIGLVAFIGFVLIHTALIIMVCACGVGPHENQGGFSGSMGDIVYGQHDTGTNQAVLIGLGIIAGIFAVYALTTWWSLKYPRQAQNVLGMVYFPFVRLMFKKIGSRQHYSIKDISEFHLINGAQPESGEYLKLLWTDFKDYRLEVKGLVEHPLSLSLEDLHNLPKQSQIVQHNCIQGWSGIAQWGGVPMKEIIARAKPLANAKYVMFVSYSDDTSGRPYHEILELETVDHPQSLLAYEMNNAPLPVPHGAPLRLRQENSVGFKMVKWLKTIEFIEDYREIERGEGGSRELNKFYHIDTPI